MAKAKFPDSLTGMVLSPTLCQSQGIESGRYCNVKTCCRCGRQFSTWLLLPLLAISFSGCLKTLVKIDSEPQGAVVYFDSHRLPEVTPTEAEVKWYGHHKFTLIKDGFETATEIIEIKSPPYLWIPLDLGATLAPYPIKDRHSYIFELNPLGSEQKDNGAGQPTE